MTQRPYDWQEDELAGSACPDCATPMTVVPALFNTWRCPRHGPWLVDPDLGTVWVGIAAAVAAVDRLVASLAQ